MKRRLIWGLRLVCLVALIGLGTLTVAAAPHPGDGGYNLIWTTAAGGSSANGSSYSLTGVSGEATTGVTSGGDYELRTGFLAITVSRDYVVYLPMVLRR